MALPLVLAGPILRRCQPADVTVWIALQHPRRVTLRVYSNSASGWEQEMIGSADTVRLGPGIYVAAVTATSQKTLSWGGLFAYQLWFGDVGGTTDVPETAQSLNTAGVVDGDADALYYPPFDRPTFVLPPTELNQLRIIQGSCRKIHGGGQDMLPMLDDLLRADSADPARRPQLLFLTGDQIYADDVAEVILLNIQSILKNARWTEQFPGTTEAELQPGRRADMVRDKVGFSAGDVSGSHLLTFGEYLLMYMMAWSPVLWPNPLPDVHHVYPRENAAHLRDLASTGLSLYGGLIAECRKHRDAAIKFRTSLPKVRRALANIATYMNFDDHEITDDWYLNLHWCRTALASPLGRRVIENGLAAYAVCQAWGNTPEYFASSESAGGRILQALAEWGRTGTRPDTLATLLGIPTAVTVDRQGTARVTDGPCWDYQVAGPTWQALVLDTRTGRQYRLGHVTGTEPPYLLSAPAVTSQIDNAPVQQGIELLIVVSANPIAGHPLIEAAKGGEGVLGAVANLTPRDFLDAEEWGLQRTAVERCYLALVRRCQRIVILSGDVHYAFAARVQHRTSTTSSEQTISVRDAVITQLTSSPLCQQDSKTEAVHFVEYGGDLPEVMEWLGWGPEQGATVTLKRIVRSVSSRVEPPLESTLPIICKRNDGVTEVVAASRPPNWRSRAEYIQGNALARPQLPTELTSIVVGGSRSALPDLSTHLANYETYRRAIRSGTRVVGINNLADVTFTWGPSAKVVLQRLWWRYADDRTPAMTVITEYPVALEFYTGWTDLERLSVG